MADRRELVLTSAQLRRADKLTHKQKKIKLKHNLNATQKKILR